MQSFTILTTEGGPVTRHLHDRMPVILDQSGFAGWLGHGNVEPPAGIETAVHLFPVSPQVNSPKYDTEDCIAPLIGKP
jgi:putative SOS response-associated peptidase YedK